MDINQIIFGKMVEACRLITQCNMYDFREYLVTNAAVNVALMAKNVEGKSRDYRDELVAQSLACCLSLRVLEMEEEIANLTDEEKLENKRSVPKDIEEIISRGMNP